jgi:hypothetical protein
MPSFWTLLDGERSGGVTVHYVDQKLDNGPILVQKSYEIGEGSGRMAKSKKIASRRSTSHSSRKHPLIENDASQATLLDAHASGRKAISAKRRNVQVPTSDVRHRTAGRVPRFASTSRIGSTSRSRVDDPRAGPSDRRSSRARLGPRSSPRGVRAFFVLGWIAERYPQLVRRIATRHELGSIPTGTGRPTADARGVPWI